MRVTPTALPGVLLVEPTVHRDPRGFFLELAHTDRYAAAGMPATFAQVNQSRSSRGVLRGLHFQVRRPQGKLVSVTRGVIWDVAVDVRRGSPTFGRWVGETLDADAPRQLWIPPGFAHGFCVLSDEADVVYQCTDVYDPGHESGLAWDDPTVAIAWPLRAPLLSAKDALNPGLDPAREDLPLFGHAPAPVGSGAPA
jgi:dTDP-4-dehydrorhamnose 3,5-epimerase